MFSVLNDCVGVICVQGLEGKVYMLNLSTCSDPPYTSYY